MHGSHVVLFFFFSVDSLFCSESVIPDEVIGTLRESTVKTTAQISLSMWALMHLVAEFFFFCGGGGTPAAYRSSQAEG